MAANKHWIDKKYHLYLVRDAREVKLILLIIKIIIANDYFSKSTLIKHAYAQVFCIFNLAQRIANSGNYYILVLS